MELVKSREDKEPQPDTIKRPEPVTGEQVASILESGGLIPEEEIILEEFRRRYPGSPSQPEPKG